MAKIKQQRRFVSFPLHYRIVVFTNRVLVPLALVAIMAACSQKQDAPTPDAACNGADAKSIVSSILKDALVKQVSSDIAGQTLPVSVEASLIRATVDKIVISIDDVLTTKSDPSSTKKFCSATVKFALPTDVIADADAARSAASLNTSHQAALETGVDFDANVVKAPLDYDVQPTDDGKKIYGSTQSGTAVLTFASTLVEQSFLKMAFDGRKAEQAKQQQQAAVQAHQQQDEISQAEASESAAQLQKTQADMQAANDALNVVWNAGSKEWRQALLPEQRLWLAEREDDCRIKALQGVSPDTTAFQTNKLNCQVEMTANRTEVLKTALQQKLSQQEAAEPPSGVLPYRTSFDCMSAKSVPEQLICHDADLAAADRELSDVYAHAKAAAKDQAAFKERTRQQWNYRQRACSDKDCLVRWYADQKAALTQIADTGNL